MIEALIVTTLLETLRIAPAPIRCDFPEEDGGTVIEVRVDPLPSLADTPDEYRVLMAFDGALEVMGSAGPITTTPDRDVMIRGATDDLTFYTIGLREDGAAALNLMWTRPADQPVRQQTRTGQCRNFERYLDEWLTS